MSRYSSAKEPGKTKRDRGEGLKDGVMGSTSLTKNVGFLYMLVFIMSMSYGIL